MIKVLPIAIACFYVLVGFANATKNRPEMGNEDNRILKQDDAASSLSMISSEELADFSLDGLLTLLMGYSSPSPSLHPSKSGKGSKGTQLGCGSGPIGKYGHHSKKSGCCKKGKFGKGLFKEKQSGCGSGKSGKSGHQIKKRGCCETLEADGE